MKNYIICFFKNLIVQTEYSNGATQWHLSNKKFVFFLFLVFFGLSLFSLFIANFLGNYLYNKKIDEYKSSYGYVSENLSLLSKKIEDLDKKIDIIEQKRLCNKVICWNA